MDILASASKVGRMTENGEEYKRKIQEIADIANKAEAADFKIRYIYRNKEQDENGQAHVSYSTKELVIDDSAKSYLITRVENTLKDVADRNDEVIRNYRFEQQITDGSVGILNDEDFPAELKKLIPEFSKAVDYATDGSRESARKVRQSIVGYAIIFKGIKMVKRIHTIELATGKKFKQSLLVGSKSNKLQKFKEDIIVLTISEPDFIIVNQGGKDTVFIYNSANFAHVCMSNKEMIERLKSQDNPINKILNKPEKLYEYLRKAPSAIHVLYFAANRSGFKIEPNYIEELNKEYFADNRLAVDENERLICENLNGRDIYLILLGKYGSHFRTDGKSEKIIVKEYQNFKMKGQ